MRVIWWMRRDLRLGDNQALRAACETGGEVVPVFVLDPKLLISPYAGEKRVAFLFEGLRSLDQELQARGSYLIVLQGDAVGALGWLLSESGANAIFAEPDYSPYAQRRDAAVTKSLPVYFAGSPAIRTPGMVLKGDGSPYVTFTPFRRAWKAHPAPLPTGPAWIPDSIASPPGFLPNHRIGRLPAVPTYAHGSIFPAGEAEALRRLKGFTQNDEAAPIYQYEQDRNRLDLEGTSALSPYLRTGMISARQVAAAAQIAINRTPDPQSRQEAETWLNELIWRDFYIQILAHFPHVRKGNFRMQGVRWENDPQMYYAWAQGQTGYPVVDAAMRQMHSTGWMHNRARMIVASFLTKDLLVDWRWGERHFMQHLLDGDPAANNGGWQWTAGTGTDAAPYFRIFNPVTQSARFDPYGRYIRLWLPELAGVPDAYIHAPWEMPASMQIEVGCRIGQDYPAPIVNHAETRERALNAYGPSR